MFRLATEGAPNEPNLQRPQFGLSESGRRARNDWASKPDFTGREEQTK